MLTLLLFCLILLVSCCVFFMNVALTAPAALVPAVDCIYRAELSSLSAAPCLLSPLSPAVWPALSDCNPRPDLSASPSLSVSGEIGRREKRITFMMTINGCSNGTRQCRILTSFSRHCSSLFLWISLICCGVMPFQRSVRTRGPSADDSVILFAASGRSVRRSEVTVYRSSARSSPSLLSLSCRSLSILSSACKGRSDVTLTFHLKDLWCLCGFLKLKFCHDLLTHTRHFKPVFAHIELNYT